MAVNLSPNTPLDDTLPNVIIALLAQTRNPPAALTLEITEGTLMADPGRSLATPRTAARAPERGVLTTQV